MTQEINIKNLFDTSNKISQDDVEDYLFYLEKEIQRKSITRKEVNIITAEVCKQVKEFNKHYNKLDECKLQLKALEKKLNVLNDKIFSPSSKLRKFKEQHENNKDNMIAQLNNQIKDKQNQMQHLEHIITLNVLKNS